MKKLARLIKTPLASYLTFALAAVLLIFGTIGGVRAAPLTELQGSYTADIEVMDIVGMTIVENGKAVGSGKGTLLTAFEADGAEEAHAGVNYPEELRITNTGTIDAYMRVIVYKYWVDDSGEKQTDLDPSLINLTLTPGGRWVLDQGSSTPERSVLYYTGVFPVGDTTAPFASSLMVDPSVTRIVTQTLGSDGTIITVYDYDGMRFCIEIEVDSVQTHNAEDAIRSAWGIDPGAFGIIG